MSLRPLRNLVLVERLPDVGRTKLADGSEVTAGGIICPADYKARGSQKAVRKADHFRARVLGVGPKVTDPLVCKGAEVVILTWADESKLDGSRRSMYTGADGPNGTLFVQWPDDFGGVVLNAPLSEALADTPSGFEAVQAFADTVGPSRPMTLVPPQAPDAPE